MLLKPTAIPMRVWFSGLNHQIMTKQSDFPWNSMFVQTFIRCVSCSVCGPWLQNFNEPHAEVFSEPALRRGMSHQEVHRVPLLYFFVHKFKSTLISLHTFPCSYCTKVISTLPLKQFSFAVAHSHPPSFHDKEGKTALEICQPTHFKHNTEVWVFLSLFKIEVPKHKIFSYKIQTEISQWKCLSELKLKSKAVCLIVIDYCRDKRGMLSTLAVSLFAFSFRYMAKYGQYGA